MRLGSQPDFIRRGFVVTPDTCPKCGAYKPADQTYCLDCIIDRQIDAQIDRLESRDRAG